MNRKLGQEVMAGLNLVVMKKYLFISMLAIAAVAAFSCAKEIDQKVEDEIIKESEEVVTPVVDNPLVITAYADDDIAPDTKTSLSGVSVLWADSDEVAAYKSGDTKPHTSTATEVADGGKKATFTFTDLTVGTDVTYIIYPADAAGDEDGGYYSITIPTEQAATANSFAEGANLAMADGSVDADAVQFKNLGALIGIKINNDDIESVKIAASEEMTGAGIVDSGFDAVSFGETYVKLTGGIDNGSQYYAVVYPSPVSGYTGLQIVAENTIGQTATYSNPNALVLNRNDNLQIANLTIANSKWYPAYNSWSYTFESKAYDAVGAKTLNGKSWTLAGEGTTTEFNYNSTKGEQFGTATKPFTSLTLSSNFGDGEAIKTVKVNASGANDIVGSISVSVGGSAFKNGENTSVSLSSSATDYTFDSPDGKVKTGVIVITLSQTSSKGLYIKSISVNPKGDPGIAWKKAGSVATTDTGTLITGDDTLPSIALDNPNAVSVTYSSDDEEVATINASTGEIALVGAGSAVISATSAETSYYASSTVSYTLTVTDSRSVCETPTFSPGASAVEENDEVTISSTTTGSTIYYTVDGSTPTTSSAHGTVGDASATVTIDVAKTVKAIAVKDDWKTSSVASATYTISGVVTPLDDPSSVAITAISATGFTATWTNNSNATGYSWMLSTSSTAPANTSDASVKAYGSFTSASPAGSGASLSSGTWTLTKTSLSLSGKYYFYVKADGDGSTYSDSGYSSDSKILIILDLSQNIFSLTAGTSFGTTNDASSEISKTVGDYTYKLKATNNCLYFNSKALAIGKTDSYITLPAIASYKLNSVSASNCAGAAKPNVLICSTANTTAITNGTATDISAGSTVSWNNLGSSANTSYRVYITNAKVAQFDNITLVYGL